MDHEYEADLLTLLDDEGQEHDDALLDKLAGIFEERFNEAYFDGEEE